MVQNPAPGGSGRRSIILQDPADLLDELIIARHGLTFGLCGRSKVLIIYLPTGLPDIGMMLHINYPWTFIVLIIAMDIAVSAMNANAGRYTASSFDCYHGDQLSKCSSILNHECYNPTVRLLCCKTRRKKNRLVSDYFQIVNMVTGIRPSVAL
ncbi:hypothetical protein CAPTEDRAFT_213570 [Capitella teleta]|uniref:Uncharacterized protein n=1 Tax=Capitella teleta TaxID=283909 RepID=R7VJ55_CAPTE|nr:hypothetical protein CAPTEDRAFT_213570 [Capitella teleta]|eukprot:ELU16356.1 hypothetical protein CAPTEDRAFT_213570 [Capitella teleta]